MPFLLKPGDRSYANSFFFYFYCLCMAFCIFLYKCCFYLNKECKSDRYAINTVNLLCVCTCILTWVCVCMYSNTSVLCWRGQRYACWTWSLSPRHAASGCPPAACTSSPSPAEGERETHWLWMWGRDWLSSMGDKLDSALTLCVRPKWEKTLQTIMLPYNYCELISFIKTCT